MAKQTKIILFFYSSLLSEINSRWAWVGINDLDVEDTFKFLDGEEAIIKGGLRGGTPVDDDDLFIKWEYTEPNNSGEEDLVAIRHTGGFYDVKEDFSGALAACEFPNPHCHEGICLHEKKSF